MARYIGAILLAALVLWTGEARGACAWVLWENDGHVRSDGSPGLAPMVPYESRAECEQEAKRSNDRVKASNERLRAQQAQRWTPGIGPVFYQCWPDTVDPRGPKEAK